MFTNTKNNKKPKFWRIDKMAVEQQQRLQRRFGYGALGVALVAGGAVVYAITHIFGGGYSRTPAEQAAREFFLGQKPAIKYTHAKDRISITFYGIRGLNEHKPNEILTPGADENCDGFPDNIGQLVVTDTHGKEISNQAMANNLNGNLDGLTFSIKPVYRQVKPDPK